MTKLYPLISKTPNIRRTNNIIIINKHVITRLWPIKNLQVHIEQQLSNNCAENCIINCTKSNLLPDYEPRFKFVVFIILLFSLDCCCCWLFYFFLLFCIILFIDKQQNSPNTDAGQLHTSLEDFTLYFGCLSFIQTAEKKVNLNNFLSVYFCFYIS